MADYKLCPMTMMSGDKMPCSKEKCSWWMNSGCAIPALVNQLYNVADRLEATRQELAAIEMNRNSYFED